MMMRRFEMVAEFIEESEEQQLKQQQPQLLLQANKSINNISIHKKSDRGFSDCDCGRGARSDEECVEVKIVKVQAAVS